MKILLILIIKLYKTIFSPILSGFFRAGCRFTPTCSAYTIEALEKHGVIKGLSLGIERFLRCHPWGGFGFDPVPTK